MSCIFALRGLSPDETDFTDNAWLLQDNGKHGTLKSSCGWLYIYVGDECIGKVTEIHSRKFVLYDKNFDRREVNTDCYAFLIKPTYYVPRDNYISYRYRGNIVLDDYTQFPTLEVEIGEVDRTRFRSYQASTGELRAIRLNDNVLTKVYKDPTDSISHNFDLDAWQDTRGNLYTLVTNEHGEKVFVKGSTFKEHRGGPTNIRIDEEKYFITKYINGEYKRENIGVNDLCRSFIKHLVVTGLTTLDETSTQQLSGGKPSTSTMRKFLQRIPRDVLYMQLKDLGKEKGHSKSNKSILIDEVLKVYKQRICSCK